ncbi:hypothetical protein EIP91_009650 [Steccherinum ochraceum]|uniref:Uncharacterized protein n=1 Tax=Steccherinum ochraceum TaxID=92696 RepID=A0A4V2MV15_9APHY|nr:hypothetical protein EIP91_009650 [Steccherinum ochraceum]
MRYSAIFAGAIAVATASVAAVPFVDGQADGLVARTEYARALRSLEARGNDRTLVIRDLLDSIYARDLNHDLGARNFKRAPASAGEASRPRSSSTASNLSGHTAVGSENGEGLSPVGRRLSGDTVVNEPASPPAAQGPPPRILDELTENPTGLHGEPLEDEPAPMGRGRH